KVRLLESPKSRLTALQRRILREILERIPAHDAAHGYRRGRSVVSHVAPHAGQGLVIRLDLRDFFPSVAGSRVHALFRTAGYPRPVARLLTGLCTNAVPPEVLRCRPGRDRRDAAHSEQRLRSAAPPAGGADLPRAGQPLRLPARPPARRPGPLA